MYMKFAQQLYKKVYPTKIIKKTKQTKELSFKVIITDSCQLPTADVSKKGVTATLCVGAVGLVQPRVVLLIFFLSLCVTTLLFFVWVCRYVYMQAL